ncbi:MAG: beta-propeller repeat-containing protein [Frankiales bacterium]|nr:beta-propeller repeat-containing protein [Frankiales bacterium]
MGADREDLRQVYRRRRIVLGVGVAFVALLGFSLVRSATAVRPTVAAHRTPGDAGAPPAKGQPLTSGTRPGVNIYAHTGAGAFAPATWGVPYRLYVPESAGTGVDVIDPVAMRVVAHFTTGLDPQHVVPSYDLKTLYSTNDLANSLTPFDPYTGRPSGPNIPVADPYNMYFTPDGKQAMVVAEQNQELDFYDAHSFAPHKRLHVTCAGVDHADFSADGSFLIASCEFAHRLVRVDLRTETVAGYLDMPGSSPQDVRISPDGRTFFVADMDRGGVHLIDAATFGEVGFLKTGRDAHGLYPSRDGKRLFVSNRGSGSITVIDFATRRILTTWLLPNGGSPDMGGVSPDGTVLWLSGRYNATVYKISTADGRLLGQIHVPNKPHGLAVWPQPGRYSLGHTGNMR